MKEFSVVSVIIINLLLTIRNFWLIKNQKTKPALAMWVFFLIAVALSLITFKSEGKYGFLDNILNTTDLVYVGLSTLAIWVYGDVSTKFNRFDIFCLIAVALIFVFWLITQNHLITNLLVQLILVIAYFPTIRRLLKTKQNTESFGIWAGMLLVSSIALISTEGILAKTYTLRAVISISLLMGLMAWFEIKKKKRP